MQLSTMLEAVPAAVLRRQQDFVRAFVRPCGLDVPATRVMADALESLAAAGPAEHPRPAPLVGKLGFAALRAMQRVPAGRRLLLDEREVHAKNRRREDEASGAAGIA